MNRTKVLRRTSRFVAEWLFLIATLLVLGGTIGYSQYHDYIQIEAQEQERLASQVKMIEENLVPQLLSTRRAIDGILDNLPAWTLEKGGIAGANQRLQTICDMLAGTRSILIMDAAGRVLSSNKKELIGRDLSKRDYFQVALKNADPKTLYVTPPYKTLLNAFVVSLYRIIPGPSGEFAGIVLVSADPERFKTLLGSVRYAPDALTYLAHGDGKLFMTVPEQNDLNGKDLAAPGNLFTRHQHSGLSASVFSDVAMLSGEKRIVAFRTIQPIDLFMDKPLVVAVSRDRQAIFSPWHKASYMGRWMFGVLTVLAILSLFFYQRRQRLFDRLVIDHEQQRHVAAQMLKASEARLQAIFDASPDPLLISTAQGMITMANQQVEHMFGFTVGELIGQPIERLLPDRFRMTHPVLRAGFADSSFARRMTQGLEAKALRKDGSECDVEVNLSRIQTDQGLFFASALRDIGERKRAEQSLLAGADNLNEAQRIAQVGSWTVDLVSGERVWSDEMFRLYEIDRNRFSGSEKAFLDAIHPDDSEAVKRTYTNCMKTRTPYDMVHRLLMRDGRIKWVHAKCTMSFDAAGRLQRSYGTAQDVTERKLSDIALRQSEQRFSTAFSSCPIAASIATAEEGRFIEANANYERDFGWAKADLIGRTSTEVGLWSDARAREPWLQAMRSEGRLVNYESIWMHKNGLRRNVSISGEMIEIEGKACILAYVTDITARKQVEQSLSASETRLRAVLDGIQNGVITITEQGIVESFNRSAERMFGYNAAEVIGNNVNMLVPEPHKAKHDSYLDRYRHGEHGEDIGRRLDVTAQRKDGSEFPIDLGITQTVLNDRKLFIGSVSDISFRKQAEVDLRIAATAFESQEGMVVTDPNGVILRVNRAFTESTGYAVEETVGQTPRLLKSGRHDAAFYAAMWEDLVKTGVWQGEIWDRRKNGEVYPKWLTISAVKDSDGTVVNYIGTHNEITERKIAEEKIKELAFFDPLTRLPNRTLLQDRLKQAMTVSARSGTCGAFLFIDLDHFKTLNDTLGHDKGDMLLQQVAQRLTASVREGDTVARLGGDEFVVLLGGLSGSLPEAASQTEALGEKFLAALEGTYRLGDIEYRSSASIGATLFTGHRMSIDDLMKQADLAMYKSKETGRNALRFFDRAMQTLVVERAALENDLRKAIEGNQFILHYQAQVVDGGRVIGAEALVRWQHPQRGMVAPNDFIPLAEETGLILPLGQWVLETACTQLAKWAARPELAHLTVAVNISAQQLRQPDFVTSVLAVVGRTGVSPNRLKLELTESQLVDNVQGTIAKMNALKAGGVGFSLDDFGTGYSSLSYLKRLPLEQLKIDRSFVLDILTDPNDAAIAKTIVALAQSLGLGVIAEGVETAAQRDFLSAAGCRCYQGYFFSRPVPIDGFEKFVQQG